MKQIVIPKLLDVVYGSQAALNLMATKFSESSIQSGVDAEVSTPKSLGGIVSVIQTLVT